MILQCDQCQTKFRLDDSKLKPGGVKVRCSKCRHVFVAGAEPKQEESDFDAILSGLGGPAPEKREEPAPPEQESPFRFGEEPATAVPPAKPAPEPPPAPQAAPTVAAAAPAESAAPHTPTADEFPDFSSFGFPSGSGAEEEPVVKGERDALTEKPGLDFGDFSFDQAPVAPEGKAEPAKPAAGEELGFGEFAFDSEPTVKPQEPAAAGPELDFGEFAFNEEPAKVSEPAAAKEAPEPAGGKEFDFSDFSFEEEAPAAKESAAAAPAGAKDTGFGEFSFGEEPPPVQEAAAAPAGGKEFDFGDFNFEEEPPPLAEAPAAAPAGGKEFDFGELSFNEEAPAAQETAAAAPAGGKEFDFGEFSFDEEPPPLKETPAAAPAEGKEFDFGEFSFDEEPAAAKATPAAAPPAADEEFTLGDFSFGDEAQKPQEKAHAPAPEEEFALGEFSFDEEVPPALETTAAAPKHEFSFGEPEPAAAPEAGFAGKLEEPPGAEGGAGTVAAGLAAAGAAAAGAAAAGAASAKQAPPVSPSETKGSPFDFDFGTGEVPTKAEGYEAGEELPPLSISSRRKGRSIVGTSVVAAAVVAILGLSGAGLYLVQKGPAAMQTFNKLGLGFVGKWFGVEAPEEGRITVRNPQGAYYQNKEAGELFVVTGEAVNSYSKPRASIHVKVSIFDKKGTVIAQKTAYCGNKLSKEQLETLPMAKLDSIMNNQFGDSLANLGVKPGQPIGFVVAFANVPKDAADFGVEVVGSTVAGQ